MRRSLSVGCRTILQQHRRRPFICVIIIILPPAILSPRLSTRLLMSLWWFRTNLRKRSASSASRSYRLAQRFDGDPRTAVQLHVCVGRRAVSNILEFSLYLHVFWQRISMSVHILIKSALFWNDGSGSTAHPLLSLVQHVESVRCKPTAVHHPKN